MGIDAITIDKFDGGRANYSDQVTLPNNVCASGSQNVWAPEGGLTKGPGLVLQASFTASGNCPMPHFIADDTVSTANKLFYRINLTATGGNGNLYYPFGSAAVFTDDLNVLGYTTGTVSISGASLISATGNGTSWSTHVSANDRINISTTANAWYLVSSVQDDTHLTLAAAVPQAVPTGTAYTVQLGLTYQEIAAASLNGSLMWSTTADNMQRYDGAGITRLSGNPQVAFLAVHKNYMFGFRTGAFPSRLYWSTIKDPVTNWPSNNFVDIDVLNGQGTGLFPYGQELICFKTRGMYKVLGDIFDPANPQYYILKITTPPDFLFNSNYSCAIHQGQLIFYGGGRMYRYIMGTTFIADISKNIIRDLPSTFGNYTSVHSNIDQQVNAVSFQDFYVIKGMARPGGGNPLVLILDRNFAWWMLNNGNDVSSTIDPFDNGRMAVVPSTSSRPQLAIGMATSYGKVFTWDFVGPAYGTNFPSTTAGGTTSNVAINGSWISKEFNIEYGTFKWIAVYLQKQSAGNLTIQWSIDQGSAVSNTVDMTMGRGQIIRAVLPVNQKGSTIQLTISNNTAGQTFKVYAVNIYHEKSPMERLL